MELKDWPKKELLRDKSTYRYKVIQALSGEMTCNELHLKTGIPKAKINSALYSMGDLVVKRKIGTLVYYSKRGDMK